MGTFKNVLYARTRNLATGDEQEQFEHKFPFTNSVKMDKYSVNEQKVHLNARRPAEFKIDSRIAYDMAYKKKLEHEKKNSLSLKQR